MRTPRIHNLSPNAKEDSPHLVAVVDCETRWVEVDGGELHTLRLWEAKAAYRHGHSPTRPRTADGGGTTAQELADWVDAQTKSSPPTWVYVHNLSFDLATTRLPLLMVDRGWKITAHNLASDAPWATLRKGTKTLRLADSWSVLPEKLETIGAKIGVPKPPLPAADDTEEQWRHRCRGDVETTMAALLQVLDWWDKHKLGHWSVTGPRTGFNAMRHLCVKRPGFDPAPLIVGPGHGFGQHGDGHVVIHPDEDARRFERTTLYQGRRDAWRVGVQPRGVYVELDMQRAHLTVAATQKLPHRRGREFESLELDSKLVLTENTTVVADCTITTDEPRYPVRTRYGIVHPVGTFTTRLAGVEIAEARDRGHLVGIGHGWFYGLSYHMQPWARWAEQVLADTEGEHPPMAHVAVKGWSRSVPGTWAARTGRLIVEGDSPVQGWLAETGTYGKRFDPCTIVHMAGRQQLILKDQEADDSFPAILSVIQAHVRLALNRMVDAVPDYRLISCNTDSLIVDSTGWAPGEARRTRRGQLNDKGRHDGAGLIQYLAGAAQPFTLTVKGTSADLRILSPQHLRLDGKPRYAGVAGGAEEVSRDEFRFHTWPKLGTQMADGDARGYVRQLRTVDLTGTTTARFAMECGCTLPPAMAIGEGGNKVIGPQYPECPRHPGRYPEQIQHPTMTLG